MKVKVKDGKRGLNFCHDFLLSLDKGIEADVPTTHPKEAGILLDWYALCKCTLPTWLTVRDKLLTEIAWFDLALDTFCNLAQGLYRYDKTAYQQWFSCHKEDILGYLRLHLDCIELTLTENDLSIEFFPDLQDISNANEQAVSRLRQLKSAIPFCEHYQAQGIWIMPFNLHKPSPDETYKNMPTKNLPFVSDVLKNEVWRKCVESQYLPDSYYRYEEVWYKLRKTALLFVQQFSEVVQSTLTGRDFDVQTAFEQGQLLTKLENVLKFVPRTLSKDEAESMGQMLPQPLKLFVTEEVLRKWPSTFGNFFHQIFEFMGNQNKNRATGKLAVYNFSNVLEHLPILHQTFASLFQHAPDYFNANDLNQDELCAYRSLVELLEVWVLEPPETPQRDIQSYIKVKKQKEQQVLTSHLAEIASRLKLQGINISYPLRTHTLYPLAYPVRYLPCTFSIRDLFSLESDLRSVITTMVEVATLADVFCFVPLYQGARFLDGGYLLNVNQMGEIAQGLPGQQESFLPRSIPSSILNELPSIPFHTSKILQIQAGVIALLGSVQVLIEKEKRLKTMESSGRAFDKKIYYKQTEKIKEIVDNIGDTASKLNTLLASIFPAEKSTVNSELVKDLLEFIEQLCQKSTNEISLESSAFNASDILHALKMLVYA
jgi:hypothetical protein